MQFAIPLEGLRPNGAVGDTAPVKVLREGFRDEGLSHALEAAIGGDRRDLYDRLRRASGLPGPRLNVALAEAFAAEVARRGESSDRLLAAMLALDERVAPYGHVDEYLVILAVWGIGARAAADAKVRGKLLELLEEAACDRTRFRVRDAVAAALVEIARAVGPSFVDVLEKWASDEQPFLSLAVATAMGEGDLLATLGPEGSARVVDALFARVVREHRAGRRHDAFRRLCKVLEVTPVAAVVRHPVVADVLVRHAAGEDEELREVLAMNAKGLKKGRAADRAPLVEAALEASKKPLRDPRHGRLPGKRGRGK
jgi:hypothetical protein